LTDPEALQHRLEQHAKRRAYAWQKRAYPRQAYDGSQASESQ